MPPTPKSNTGVLEFKSHDGPPAGIVDDLSMSISVIKPDALETQIDDFSHSDSFVVRAKKRYKTRLIVTVEIDGKVFKTHSRDVSVGGVNVEDLIPDWVTGYFKVRLQKPNNKQAIELQCCLVEGQAPNARYRFQILPLQNPVDEQNLERWLAA